jgi:hypothetical protein
MTVSDSSWVKNAGYLLVRRRQGWLSVAGGAPYLWFLAHRDFDSSGFLWASLALFVVPTLATAWAAARLRCHVCGIPVYAFWLLGFPRGWKRPAFEALLLCPYCADDGTGTTGDATAVDRPKEIRVAVRYALLALSLFAGVMALVFVLMLLGWFPNY